MERIIGYIVRHSWGRISRVPALPPVCTCVLRSADVGPVLNLHVNLWRSEAVQDLTGICFEVLSLILLKSYYYFLPNFLLSILYDLFRLMLG